MRKTHRIILRDSDGNLHVAYLYRNGDRWYLNFNWLDNDFNGNNRLLRCQSLHNSPAIIMSGEFLFEAILSFLSNRLACFRQKTIENLCLAWREFIIGKKSKLDVRIFANDLMDNIVSLHEAVANQTYRHGGYTNFFVNDPKQRHIHKACVRDRLLHRAVYRILYPFFVKTFIADSFSGQNNKGTLLAINRFKSMAGKVSHNFTSGCWVLKCDIKKFFPKT